MVGALISRFNVFYQKSYEAHPLRTLILANSALQTTGDVIAQGVNGALNRYNGKPVEPYDPVRTARFAAFGFAMGPFLGKWIMMLDKVFPFPKGGSAIPAVVKRVAADQLVFAPIGLATFFTLIGAMEGKDMDGIKEKFDDVYMEALKTNWTVWPAIQAINFGIVPLPYRLPFQQGTGILWTTYMSTLNARQDREAEAAHHQVPKDQPS